MKLKQYLYLMRLHKPIGIFLLLWPTLWALWLAGRGNPDPKIVLIFILGVVVMRSAGCIINDFADRDIDKHVARTRDRPLTSNKITTREALTLFGFLLLIAFGLALFLNRLTIMLAFAGAFFAIIYPFLKRYTHLPQAGLGIAYAWAVPMAFAAQNNEVTLAGWQVFLVAALWPVMYDTMYAMVDRPDDLKIGVKSTAVLFGKYDRLIVGLMQVTLILLLLHMGVLFGLTKPYFLAVLCAAILFVYQQWLIRHREPAKCFRAFLNNNLVGVVIFLGILFS